MVGAYAPYAQQFLLVFATATTLFFALPIFLTPLTWGKLMRFKLPSETDLAVYFGRCLGAFALIVEALVFRAAFTGVAIVFTFQTATSRTSLLTSMPASVAFLIIRLRSMVRSGPPDPVPAPTNLVDAGSRPRILHGIGEEGGGPI